MSHITHQRDVADTLNGYEEIAAFLRITVRQAKHRASIGAFPIYRQGRLVCARKSRLLASFDRKETEAPARQAAERERSKLSEKDTGV